LHYAELHTFNELSRLDEALTHASYANENPGATSNQRLEFLGDAVLELLVSEMLVERFPAWDEGSLSKARSHVVDTGTLARLSAELGLPGAIRGGKGLVNELRRGGKVWADLFEAFIAAIYLDAGLDRARAVVRPLLAPALDGLTPEALKDPKSALQELFQGRARPAPRYREVGRTGPAHEPTFACEVLVEDRVIARGTGRSRREAETAAARLALDAESAVEPT